MDQQAVVVKELNGKLRFIDRARKTDSINIFRPVFSEQENKEIDELMTHYANSSIIDKADTIILFYADCYDRVANAKRYLKNQYNQEILNWLSHDLKRVKMLYQSQDLDKDALKKALDIAQECLNISTIILKDDFKNVFHELGILKHFRTLANKFHIETGLIIALYDIKTPDLKGN